MLAQSTSQTLPLALGLTLPIGIAGVYLLTMWIIARATGWASLARRFPAVEPAPGADRGRVASIRFGPAAGYNNCINWHADDTYLHLRLMPVFGIFHPPMSIPWTAIEIDPPRRWTARIHIDGRAWTVPSKMVSRELALREQLETVENQPS